MVSNQKKEKLRFRIAHSSLDRDTGRIAESGWKENTHSCITHRYPETGQASSILLPLPKVPFLEIKGRSRK